MSPSPNSSRFPRFFAPTVLLALTLASSTAWPQPLTFVPGPVFRVDAPVPGAPIVGSPQAAKAPGINCTLVAWMRGQARAVFAQQLCPDRFGPELVLARAPGKQITDFSLSAGWYNYALAWTVAGPAGQRTTFARIFDIFARPVGPPFRIDMSPLEPGESLFVQSGPKVGIYDSGRLVVAWIEEVERGDLRFFRARARRYALDGTPGAEVLVGAAEGAYAIKLAVAPGGSYMVAWETYGEDPAATRVELRLYGADDIERPLAAQPGSAPVACPRPATEWPAIAGGYERFFVAFMGAVGQSPDGVDPRCIGVFAQVYDLDGGLVRGEFRVKRSSWSPIVQHDRSHFLVTWSAGPISTLPAPGGSPVPGLYVHPYELTGYSAGPEMRVQEQPITGVGFGPFRPLLVWPAGGVMARYLTPP